MLLQCRNMICFPYSVEILLYDNIEIVFVLLLQSSMMEPTRNCCVWKEQFQSPTNVMLPPKISCVVLKKIDGSSCRGRPRKLWRDTIKEWTGQSLSSLLYIANNCYRTQ